MLQHACISNEQKLVTTSEVTNLYPKLPFRECSLFMWYGDMGEFMWYGDGWIMCKKYYDPSFGMWFSWRKFHIWKKWWTRCDFFIMKFLYMKLMMVSWRLHAQQVNYYQSVQNIPIITFGIFSQLFQTNIPLFQCESI